jgi:hypothetical protein
MHKAEGHSEPIVGSYLRNILVLMKGKIALKKVLMLRTCVTAKEEFPFLDFCLAKTVSRVITNDSYLDCLR